MALKQKIQDDLQVALREKRELELSVLRMLAAAITNKEKEKRYKKSKENPEATEGGLEKESQLTEEETMEVVSSEVKKRKEALLLFEKGAREDLAEKEKKEVEVLRKYLPEQISEEEIKNLAKEAIERTGAKDVKDMGRVMAELMPKVKGKADGSLVSKIIKELLADGRNQ
jgi:uncharacterized protein YqeY